MRVCLACLAYLVSVLAGAGCGGQPRIEQVPEANWARVLSQYQGRPLVVCIWASWCETCAAWLAAVTDLEDHYGGQLSFVSVNLDDGVDSEESEAASTLLRDLNADFDHYSSPPDITGALSFFEVSDPPAVLIFDAKGEVQARVMAEDYPDATPREILETAILAALAGRSGSSP